MPILLTLFVLAGFAMVTAYRERNDSRMRVVAGVLLIASTLSIARTVTYELRDPANWHLSLAESALMVGDLPQADARIEEALTHPLTPNSRQRLVYLATLRTRM